LLWNNKCTLYSHERYRPTGYGAPSSLLYI